MIIEASEQFPGKNSSIGDQNSFWKSHLKNQGVQFMKRMHTWLSFVIVFFVIFTSLFFIPVVSFGGGVVNGGEPLTQANGDEFNNEIFTDKNLVTSVNNDLIRTPSTADPVSTVTGNMYYDETDITINGRGLNYAFTRTYNSGHVALAQTGLPLSKGWTHSYNMRLIAKDYGQFPNSVIPSNIDGVTSSVTYTDERGGEVNYLVSGGVVTIPNPKGIFDSLVLNTDSNGAPSIGTHTLTFRNGVKYIFDSAPVNLATPGQSARLKQILDPFGNELNFGYSNGRLTSISDNIGVSGRTGLTLAYDGNGRLQTVSDWTSPSRNWIYGYDSKNRLASFSNPLGHITTYSYSGDGDYLTEVSFPADRGNGAKSKSTFSYYQNGKTFENANGLGETETLFYDLYRKRTRVSDAAGNIRTYFYDKNGAMTQLEEPDGGILLFGNNEDGLRNQKTNALGFSTQYSYNSDRSFGNTGSDNFGRVSKEKGAEGFSIEYDYGIFDQISQVRDKKGNIRSYFYFSNTDANTGALLGKLQRVENTIGAVYVPLKEYTYTLSGNIKTKTEYIDSLDLNKKRITTYTYDGDDFNPIEITISESPSGNSVSTTLFSWDNLGRKISQTLLRRTSATDSTLLSISTSFEYDALSRVIAVTDPLGNISRTVYDENGKVFQNIVDYKKPDGTFVTRIIETNTFDAADRQVKKTDINGNQTHFKYDSRGNLIELKDASNHITRFEYDSMNRQIKVINATGGISRSVYDLAGRVDQIIDRNGNTTSFEYDKLGRQKKITNSLNKSTTKIYDGNGNLAYLNDPNGHTINHSYDSLNRRIQTIDAEEGITKFTYDLLGNRTSLTDPQNNVTTFHYDGLGRLTETVDPLIQTPNDKTTTYTYDEVGNVLTMTDRNGEQTRYFYDKINRLIRTEFLTDGTEENREYDIFGDLTKVENGDVTYIFTYDNKHRLIEKTDQRTGIPDRSLAWTYDAVGNILTKTGYDGFITQYQYNAANRLTAMRNLDHLQISYFYDPAGRLVNRILSNNTKSYFRYYPDNRLKELINENSNGSELNRIAYNYDSAGNISSVTETRQGISETTSYLYDDENRLTSVDTPGTEGDHTYTYDKAGNRLTRSIGGNVMAYIYNSNNQTLEVRQDYNLGPLVLSFEYDANGNRIKKKNGIGTVLETYGWDQKNRVKWWVLGGIPYFFRYDPHGNRIEKQYTSSKRKYYLEGDHLELIANENDEVVDRYFRGVVIDEIVHGYHYDSSKTEMGVTFHHDHLQSVTGLTGRLGENLSAPNYGPFGKFLGSSSP